MSVSVATMTQPSALQSQFAGVEDAFYSNIILLGIEVETAEKKYGCQINKSMFRAPNPKGMEAILYFLLMKSCPEAADTFRVLWPILDKKQSRDFKSSCHALLMQLEKEGHLPAGTVRLSHLHSCSGERFYIMVWHLSTYALKKQLEIEKYKGIPVLPGLFSPCPLLTGATSQISASNYEALKKSTQLQIQLQSKKMLNLAQKMSSAEKEWKKLAASLETEYRTLSKNTSSLNQQIREFDAHCKYEESIKGEKSIPLDREQLESANKMWESLLVHIESTQSHRLMIDEIIHNRANNLVIDGRNIRVDTSGLPTGGVSMSLETPDGKIDLVNLTKVWNLCLKELHSKMSNMTRQISQQSLKNAQKLLELDQKENSGANQQVVSSSDPLAEMTERLETLTIQHQQYTENIRTVISRLRESIPETHQAIAELQQILANAQAATNLASNLKQLLQESAETSYAPEVGRFASNMKIGAQTPSKASSAPVLKSLNGQTSFGSSMGNLIPPTPRHQPLSGTNGKTPSFSQFKSTSMPYLPNSTPSSMASSARRPLQIPSTPSFDSPNILNEQQMIEEMTMSIRASALGQESHQTSKEAKFSAVKSSKKRIRSQSPNRSVAWNSTANDVYSSNSSSTPSFSTSSSFGSSSNTLSSHSSPILRSLDMDPSFGGISPLHLENNHSSKYQSSSSPFSFSLPGSASNSPTLSQYHSINKLNSPDVANSPFTFSINSRQGRTPSPQWNHSQFSSSPSLSPSMSGNNEFIRVASRRSRGSLEIPRTSLSDSHTEALAPPERPVSPTLFSNHSIHSHLSGNSPTMMNQSPLLLARSNSPTINSLSPRSSSASPNWNFASNLNCVANESLTKDQERAMEELAEQIVDLMGASSNNMSSSEVARQTIMLLGGSSPRSQASLLSAEMPTPRSSAQKRSSALASVHSNVEDDSCDEPSAKKSRLRDHPSSSPSLTPRMFSSASSTKTPKSNSKPSHAERPTSSGYNFAQTAFGFQNENSPKTLHDIEKKLELLDQSQSEFDQNLRDNNGQSMPSSVDNSFASEWNNSFYSPSPRRNSVSSNATRNSLKSTERRNPFSEQQEVNDVSISEFENLLERLSSPVKSNEVLIAEALDDSILDDQDEVQHDELDYADKSIDQGDLCDELDDENDEDQLELERELLRIETEARNAKLNATERYTFDDYSTLVDAEELVEGSCVEFEQDLAEEETTQTVEDILLPGDDSGENEVVQEVAQDDNNGTNIEILSSIDQLPVESAPAQPALEKSLPASLSKLSQLKSTPPTMFSLESFLLDDPIEPITDVAQLNLEIDNSQSEALEKLLLSPDDDDLVSVLSNPAVGSSRSSIEPASDSSPESIQSISSLDSFNELPASSNLIGNLKLLPVLQSPRGDSPVSSFSLKGLLEFESPAPLPPSRYLESSSHSTPSQVSQAPSGFVKGSQKNLNLSINPDEEAEASAVSSPGLERVTKVLFFD